MQGALRVGSKGRDSVSTIADLVKTARANALTGSLAKKAAPTEVNNAAKSADQAAIKSLSGNYFSNQVEKHLSDYRRGRPGFSKDTAGKLQVVDEANGQLLRDIDPKALTSYGAYGSFMSYEKRSRFVSNVYSSVKNISELKKTLNNA
jgi:hypothetical protein